MAVIKGVREGVQERIGKGVGLKMTVGNDRRVFQMNRTNKTSIKEDINILGGSNFAGLLCREFRSP